MQDFVFRPKRIQGGKKVVARVYTGQYRFAGDAKPTRVSLGTSDKRVAEEKLRLIVQQKELERAGLVPPKAQTEAAQKLLKEHLDAYLLEKSETRDERYLYELKNRVLKLIAECGWSTPKQISPEAFTAWRQNRRKKFGNSNKTLNEYLLSIRAVLNWLVFKKRILSNPLQGVEMLPASDSQVRPRRGFSHAEICRLLAVSGARRVVYLSAVMTGLRRGELAALEAADVLLDEGQSRIVARASTTKNGKRAEIPLHKQAAAELRQLLAAQKFPKGAKIFGDLLPTMEEFKSDLKKAGIPFLDGRGRRADFHSLL